MTKQVKETTFPDGRRLSTALIVDWYETALFPAGGGNPAPFSGTRSWDMEYKAVEGHDRIVAHINNGGDDVWPEEEEDDEW